MYLVIIISYRHQSGERRKVDGKIIIAADDT